MTAKTEPRCSGAMLWNGEKAPNICPRCGATENDLCRDFDAQARQWVELQKRPSCGFGDQPYTGDW